ncbi:MAG: DedA family protein [Lachnospiraceae bacterium]|nr:DedA family protein [Lachnospiraceae bacterium]
MDVQVLTEYFQRYGAVVIFVIVFLEYLNLPGFPSGVVMPLAGIWAYQGNIGFITALTLSVIAGLCGSWVLYFAGWYGGDFVLKKYVKKFPKQKEIIDKTIERVRTKGYLGIFVGKLIPVLRTIISIPAGVLKVKFTGYTIASTLGILVWNFVFVGAGYLFGETVLEILA